MVFSKEELILINEALKKAKANSETVGYEFEKKILDRNKFSSNENVNSMIQELYNRLLDKIESHIEG